MTLVLSLFVPHLALVLVHRKGCIRDCGITLVSLFIFFLGKRWELIALPFLVCR